MRWVTALVLVPLFGPIVLADDRPKPIPAEVVKVWQDEAGARLGRSAAVRWTGFVANDPFEEKAVAGAGQLPTFVVGVRDLPGPPRRQVLADLKALPAPDVPFALYLHEWAGHRRLQQVARFTTVESLNCSTAQVSDGDFEHLAGLRNLRSLDLSLTSVSWAIPSALAGFPNLTDLSVSGTNLHDKTADLIVEKLPQLRSLNISDTPITDAGVEALARHKNIQHLHLRGTKISDGGLNRPATMALRTLDLGSTKVTDAGMKHVGGMKALESLLLYSTAVTDRGVEELTRLDRLRRLNVHVAGGIGRTGLEAVCRMKALEALVVKLDAAVTPETVLRLSSLPKLRQLHVTQATLDEARVARLQKAMPGCKITWTRRN